MGTMVADKQMLHEQMPSKGLPVYTAVIHKNEDGMGYWAVCEMPNGGASTIGDTIHETQKNMYESMSLFLEDDYPDVKDFFLTFALSDE